ncbi:MAG: type I restriction-modification enzyme R subunit C-terminal domain-containing protein, partial [Clostridium sp.]
TYAYELEKAVEDKYLVDYETLEYESKVMKDGIKYEELSDEDKEQYENTFDDDENIGNEISSSAINEWLFNETTIDLVLNKLMEKALRIKGNEEVGKTIIFAKNNKHAKVIVDRFNKLYPELGADYCKEVDYSIKYVDSIIDDFSDKDKKPQIAVSVDMLDTGIDIPEILNLVFFKKVRSKSKFWQMIGRGTRLCPNLLSLGEDKNKFLIFDFCNNFDFFKVNPKGFKGGVSQSLTEKLFNLKVDLVKELQNIKYLDDEYGNYRQSLLQNIILSINSLNENSFRVKMELAFVHKYKNENCWQGLGVVNINEIKTHISPLIDSITDDEFAKRFDITMYTIQLAKIQEASATKAIKSVIETAEGLSKLGTIPQIQEKKDIIEAVKREEFWKSADIFALDKVREALRELVKYLEDKTKVTIYTTNFDDMFIKEEENKAFYNVNDLKNYRKKVEYYLKEHQDQIAVYKLRNNKELTKEDLKSLENIMWHELGTKADYEKEFKEMPLTKLVRKIVGLDRNIANNIFSEFLNDKSLNTKQIHFVELIIDYVVKNGFIEDKKVLQQEPFRNVGSIVELFKDNMNCARNIMSKVDSISEKLNIV